MSEMKPRWQQELRIRESEALKSALLENSLDPIITVDTKV